MSPSGVPARGRDMLQVCVVRGSHVTAAFLVIGATGGSSSGVIFYGSDGALTSNSSLIYNSSSERLGIGTDSPDYTLDVAGNIGLNEYIYHNGDTNTYIRFRGDQIDFVAGNITMLTLDEASNDKVIILSLIHI